MNEKMKDVNCVCIIKDGNEVKAVAMKNVDKVILDGHNIYTVADSALSGSKIVATAKAKCGPNDIFDFNIGAKLAMDRLYEGYDMTPKPKRKPYNGKIFVHHYPGAGLLNDCLYCVKDGLIQGYLFHNPYGVPYIYKDMTNDELCRAIQIDVYGSDAPSAKVVAYFVRNESIER